MIQIRTLTRLSLSLGCLLATLGVAQVPTIPEDVDKAARTYITRASLEGPIRFLSSDLIEGRGPATRGDQLARLYLQTQLESMGYQPAFASGEWQQPFDIVALKSQFPASWSFQGQTGTEATASVSMERICRMTAETFNISFNDLMKKKSRQQAVLLPRQVAMYLTRELTASSFTEIGHNFNDMHHSTVMNAINSVKNRMVKDGDFHKLVHSLLNSIQ